MQEVAPSPSSSPHWGEGQGEGEKADKSKPRTKEDMQIIVRGKGFQGSVSPEYLAKKGVAMAKHKNEMKKIHKKKIKKVKEKLKEFEKRNISFGKLNRLAKKILYKRIKAGYEFPAKISSA